MKKRILTYVAIIATFLGLAYGFVPQVLAGKIVNQSDISGWKGMSHETVEWNKAHPDDQSAWTGSMFSGMPTTSFYSSTRGDWSQKIYDLLLTGKRPASYLFISLLGAFLLMLSLGIHPIIAAGGAVAITFCSYNLQIIQVGHNTKMQALAFLPWVLAALIFTYRKACEGGRRWLTGSMLGAALFGLTLSFQIKANHPQISYYLAIMIALYVLVLVIWIATKKDRKKTFGRFFAASALLLVLGLAGIGTNASKLLPTLEYTPHSMRGGSSAKADGSKDSKGLDLAYATAWSYAWEELPNMLIPNYNGGSSSGAVNPDKSETYKLLKRAGQANADEVCRNLPLYWGPQPFTAGPMYMGAITIFLFILGLCYGRGKEKWWVLACSLLAILLALGNHFLWFTKLFHDYVPMYNKFRTVSMSLTVLQFTLPILGFMMLDRMVRSTDDTKTLRRQVIVSGSISAGLILVLALLQSLVGSFTGAVDAGQHELITEALVADRRHLLWADTWRSMALVVCAAALLAWGFGRRERKSTAALLVCLLVAVDLLPAGKRYLDADDFISPKKFESQFNKRPVDEMILADKDPSYRVLDLSVNVFNDSHPSYWHKNIGGYSPAKLQRYQEYIDSHLAGEINSIYKALGNAATVQEATDAMPYCEGLAALNCRYIIVGAENPPIVYKYAKGPAWFESEGIQEDGTKESCDIVEMTSYAPNRLKYNYSSASGGRVVFSEVYYPEGWTLRLKTPDDGIRELPIELYGELLRSAIVPAGEGELEMVFEPKSYAQGEIISRTCSISLLAIVLLALLAAYLPLRRRKELQ